MTNTASIHWMRTSRRLEHLFATERAAKHIQIPHSGTVHLQYTTEIPNNLSCNTPKPETQHQTPRKSLTPSSATPQNPRLGTKQQRTTTTNVTYILPDQHRCTTMLTTFNVHPAACNMRSTSVTPSAHFENKGNPLSPFSLTSNW